ncbi:outer membrane assembly protein AsmA [Gilliamella sp. B14384H2]|uniref:outer membrane assembly protein AsmA n=1 Tax=unclassified Gilliamella TaxID=2685620 RepID=UPI0018DCBD88|nr:MULTISPECIES: outer membrane assembly protein AsmA [unclassified Gilliamella]MBI0037184.1 outer membrane assembly protein AsmA [Gilliamella sp. B14384G10]MBI0039163.1 outer membrane assembly protein AsmA [Gilliamella sp. B14384G7]MBI0051178.1 outer membrane assembly protein AsmA [Gilliamella sp. B14384G13]MBI0053471.1 outer membrane assembly protein AsmA [Gilliamella sp. B14384H2]
MIKKILVILFILILVIVISIVSLIVFVDPNHFRGYISQTVKDKTGYELTIEGDLRWHIWPQVSILTDAVKLSDTGATKPLLTADNMRLDVELLPLFSKNLAIKNVFIKSALINITDESKGDNAKKYTQTLTPPSQPNTDISENKKNVSNWKFSLNKFEIADSTVALQYNNDLINFRNINLLLEQNNDKNLSIELKGNIDKNQQDLFYSVNANVDLTQFPEKAIIDLKKLDYSYNGIASSNKALKGSATGVFNYQQSPKQLNSQKLVFSVNDNNFTSKINTLFDNKPYVDLQLSSEKLDLTPFLQQNAKSNKDIPVQQTSPVVSSVAKDNNQLSILNAFDGKTTINIKEIKANKIIMNNVKLNVDNQDGIATFKDLNFDFANGHITATGTANGKQKTPQIKLNTKINNINLNSFFTQMDMAYDLDGIFNASGILETNSLTTNKLLESLKGNANIVITNAKLNNINIQNIIESAAAKYGNGNDKSGNQKKYTEFHKINTNAYLNQGNIELNSLNANSETLDIISGSGKVGMLNHDLDVNLNIKLLGGWNSKSDTIAKLQKVTIPLRIYGQFSNLRYQLDIAQILSDVFSDKLQQRLDKLRDKLENRNGKDKDKDKLKSKAVDILGGLLKK